SIAIRAIEPSRTGQRIEPRLDIGRDKVANLPVYLVQAARRIEHGAAFLVDFRSLLAALLQRRTQPLLVLAGDEDRIEVETGKRLPLAFENGNDLPQRIVHGGAFRHFAILSMIPAAIIASATLAGRIG